MTAHPARGTPKSAPGKADATSKKRDRLEDNEDDGMGGDDDDDDDDDDDGDGDDDDDYIDSGVPLSVLSDTKVKRGLAAEVVSVCVTVHVCWMGAK